MNNNQATKPRSGDRPAQSNETGLSMCTYSYGTHDQVARFTDATKAIAELAGTTYNYGKEIWTLLMDKTEATFPEPSAPADATDKAALEKYKMLLRMWIDDEKEYRRDKSKVFRVIMSQCTMAMKNKIETLPGYKKFETDDDVIALLGKMKELVYSTDKAQYEFWTMQAAMRKLINLKQGDKESLTDFNKRFLDQQEVTEVVWGLMTPQIMKSKSSDEQIEARDKYLACLFLAGVDRIRYQDVVNDLNNDFILGKVSYPADTSGMLTLLSNRRGNGGTSKQEQALRDGLESQGTAFFQNGPRCYACGELGHVAHDCPDPEKKAANDKRLAKKKKKKEEARLVMMQHEDDAASASDYSNDSH